MEGLLRGRLVSGEAAEGARSLGGGHGHYTGGCPLARSVAVGGDGARWVKRNRAALFVIVEHTLYTVYV